MAYFLIKAAFTIFFWYLSADIWKTISHYKRISACNLWDLIRDENYRLSSAIIKRIHTDSVDNDSTSDLGFPTSNYTIHICAVLICWTLLLIIKVILLKYVVHNHYMSSLIRLLTAFMRCRVCVSLLHYYFLLITVRTFEIMHVTT